MARLKTSDFHYDLPRAFIAQEPPPTRGASRLLVHHLVTGRVEHRRFSEFGEYLRERSLLILNDTKVIPARLYGRKAGTGGQVEVFLLREREGGEWECLLKPGVRLRRGAEIAFEGSRMTARVAGRKTSGVWSVHFEGGLSVMDEIEKIGHVPLPPYIKRANPKSPPYAKSAGGRQIPDPNIHEMPDGERQRIPDPRDREDRERYQTVYARQRGAVAAPTAGLHFSTELLERLASRGIETATLTLHVGLGTFRPVSEEYVADHRMHPEWYEIGEGAAERINRARGEGRQIVVVGTTAARALEAAADEGGVVRAGAAWTEIFIYPPYRFRVVENLLTNFHLPGSTLLMLVAALAGRERVLELYEIAKREGYRFYSYGDAMLILNPKSRIPNPKR
ncbi:MAG: S-adenosylmethionine:tRNA ribosyltransferase-isomerase [Candidatus Aureabacteria bacterium]|nr:S-adenosylmethionine:tRNA ribosyltransferase-isomerase [Candidatus Auribacterota bacterium]